MTISISFAQRGTRDSWKEDEDPVRNCSLKGPGTGGVYVLAEWRVKVTVGTVRPDPFRVPSWFFCSNGNETSSRTVVFSAGVSQSERNCCIWVVVKFMKSTQDDSRKLLGHDNQYTRENVYVFDFECQRYAERV